MSLTFILILLLVIGIVFANIALLRFGSKPMPVKEKRPATTSDTAPGKTQAATTNAMPLTTTPQADPSKSNTESNKSSTSDSSSDSSSGSE